MSESEMRKIGRPRLPFDWDLVTSLVMAGCSESFIAERLLAKEGIPENFKSIQKMIKLLQRRITEKYGCSFVQFREQKIETKKLKLSQLQWKSAEAGNVTMQIWLGKNLLGQTDKVEQKVEATVQGNVTYTTAWGGLAEPSDES